MSILGSLNTHGDYDILIYFGFSALVSTMPAVTEKSSAVYQWAYGFLHALSGNLDKVRAAAQTKVGNGIQNGGQKK